METGYFSLKPKKVNIGRPAYREFDLEIAWFFLILVLLG
jgi:hypothetical protein